MPRTARLASWTASLALAVAVVARDGRGAPDSAQSTRAEESPGRDLPAAFAPFEYLVGQWNGQAVPKDNAAQQFRGWPESHSWAWVFTQGKPSGLSVAIAGGKVLATGKLTFDPARNRYRLEG